MQDKYISSDETSSNTNKTFQLIPVYLASNNQKGYKTFCLLKTCFIQAI